VFLPGRRQAWRISAIEHGFDTRDQTVAQVIPGLRPRSRPRPTRVRAAMMAGPHGPGQSLDLPAVYVYGTRSLRRGTVRSSTCMSYVPAPLNWIPVRAPGVTAHRGPDRADAV